MPELVSYNGEIFHASELRIPWQDRANLFGDGVYEVLMCYAGRFPTLRRHLQRLERSLRESGIGPLDLEKLRQSLFAIYRQSALDSALVYLHISRGCAEKRNHHWSAELKPTILISIAEPKFHPAEYYRNGVTLISLPDLRWGRCDIKSLQLMPNGLAKHEAAKHGAFEALLTRGSRVTECAASSALMIDHGVLYAPPHGPEILPGITRNIVLECAAQLGIPVRLEWKSLQDYRTADEVLLTGTTTLVMPVNRIDDQTLPASRPITTQLQSAYQTCMQQEEI